MKAIRSLEQHVDCLRSYDFSALSEEELLERRRSWMTAEFMSSRSYP